MKLLSFFFLMVLTFVLPLNSQASTLEQGATDSSLLPRVSKLSPDQRATLFQVLKEELDYGSCGYSILDCVQRASPDATAIRMMNFGAYLVSRGVSPDNLRAFLRDRAQFRNAREVQPFSLQEAPLMGEKGARITIVEFADFKCPTCASMSPLLKKLVEDSNGAVRLFFKHFPLKGHPGSVPASRAAQAAHRQGKFSEMSEILFMSMSDQTMEELLEYAQIVGLDMDKFKQDFGDVSLLHAIERDKMEGVRAKVTGVPSLFIDGKFYNLHYDEAFLKDVINEEADRLRLKPPYKEWAYRKPI